MQADAAEAMSFNQSTHVVDNTQDIGAPRTGLGCAHQRGGCFLYIPQAHNPAGISSGPELTRVIIVARQLCSPAY